MKSSLLLIFLSLNVFLYSQELLIPNGFVKNENSMKSANLDTLLLPFFEDFSNKEVFTSNFTDNYISIENNSAILPPSIGVAMFDAVDEEGNFYASSYNSSLTADFLTSQPIDLYLPDNSTVFFSFYYQAQGMLDMPEEDDSLVLQFFAPNQNKWYTVWSVNNANNNDEFERVIFNISDSSFLQLGFKFRFYNRISMPTNAHPSLVSNCDQWFVDYIYLNKNRTENDTTKVDVAFQYPINFKIDNYQTIPYQHYKDNVSTADFNHSYFINYRNNDKVGRDIDSLYIVFKDKNEILENDTLRIGSSNFDAYDNFDEENSDINFEYPIIDEDEIVFTMNTVLITNTGDYLFNNTISQHKELSTVYAYDDGTSENGYDLYGTGTLYSYVSQKYYTYSDDYLTGIQVYFNKTFKSQQPYYFYAVVWENNDEDYLPGDKVYEQEGFEIDFDNLNNFQVFTFDEPVLVTDTFFIGWMKTTEDFMNVGMDMHFKDENYKYYNVSGTWQPSSFNGVLMIRPIFGNTQLANNSELIENYRIYPNPTSDIVNIEFDNNSDFSVEVFDYTGKSILFQNTVDFQTQINLSSFPTGIYILKILIDDKVYTEKIIRY